MYQLIICVQPKIRSLIYRNDGSPTSMLYVQNLWKNI